MKKILKKLGLILTALVFFALICIGGCIFKAPQGVVVEKNIEYARINGKSLRLDIYRPQNVQKKLPVIVWLYGGGWEFGSKFYCPIAFMATQQVAVVSINYRLDGVAKFPAQIYDCKGAVRWLRANAEKYNLDADRIGIFGASAGGHLALLLATTPGNPKMEGDVGGNLNFSSRVQCVCAFYPPTDLNRLGSDPKTRHSPDGLVAKLLGGPVADNVEKANFASPINYVTKNCPPVFLMHGGADTLVPPEQSEIFYEALKKTGVDVQLEIVPGKGHGITAPPDVAPKIYQFFTRYLGSQTNQTAAAN
jgi:acetyl esterase/lipase